MQYDPIKKSLGVVFNANPILRKLFYKLLDVLLLRAWHIKKQLKKWAQNQTDPIHVLDAGSGFGQYSYYMASHHKTWVIEAVDVKIEQVEDCTRFFKKCGLTNTHFEVADLTQQVKENTYNLILSVDVMEHIKEDEQVFDNFYRSLKKGGMLLISTPSDQDSPHEEEHHDSFVDEHVRDGYSPEDIETKLKKAGFSNIDVFFTYGKPGKLAWKLSMKIPLQLLNISKLFFIVLPVWYIISFPFALILNSMDVNSYHKAGTGLLVKAQK